MLFRKQPLETKPAPPMLVSPDDYAMFMIHQNINYRTIIAPSLLSCIACLFLSDKVGFMYHANCGVLKDSHINVIKRTFVGNKIALADVKIILAASEKEEKEVDRLKKTVAYLEKQGFTPSNIQFVFEAWQYSANSRGEHGIAISANDKHIKTSEIKP